MTGCSVERFSRVGALVLCVMIWGCEDLQSLEAAHPEVGATAQAVVGGEPATACQWPGTVDINGCTGTLIHPRVVTTAAHCLQGGSMNIRFGVRDEPGTFSLMGRCTGGSRGVFWGGGGVASDWAYCVLPEDERVKKIPYTPPLVGCEAEKFLKPGAEAWIVGYGTTGPNKNDNGPKRQVAVKVNRIEDGVVNVGDREYGACHGDSGGPVYMELKDGANDYGVRVFGSTHGAGEGNCDCNCSTDYTDIANHVKAIEENEDIDVTPCTNASGAWEPSAECTAFLNQPRAAMGNFPDCVFTRTTAPISSCGATSGPAAGSGAAAGAGGGPAAGAGATGAAGAGVAGAGPTGVAGATGAAGVGVTGSGGSGAAGSIGAQAGSVASAGRGAAGMGGGAPGVGVPVTGVNAGAAGALTGMSSAAVTGAPLAGGGAVDFSPAPQAHRDEGCSAIPIGTGSRSLSGLGLWALSLTLAAARKRRRRSAAR